MRTGTLFHENGPPLKMYVLVKDSVPVGLGANSIGHAVLACYLKFKDHPETVEWLASPSFKKVTCVVSDEEYERAKGYDDRVIMTEMALDGAEISMAFRPRRDWPKFFGSLKLYGSNLIKIEDVNNDDDDVLEKAWERATGMTEEEAEYAIFHPGPYAKK